MRRTGEAGAADAAVPVGAGAPEGEGESRPSRVVTWVDDPRARGAAWVIAAVFGLWFVVQWFWPITVGQTVAGAVLGGLTALIALSLALVYRANRIVNFAAADLGSIPATLGVLLITAAHFHYFLAIPVALAAGLVLGALVEVLVIRRFFRSSRLILTVVTIGLAQVLGALATLLPQAFDQDIPPQDYPSPFDWRFAIGNQIFTGNYVIAMLAIPAVIGLLVVFFKFTDVGIAVRAAASSADRAYLLGVPVKRMQTMVWMLAGFLATLSMLLRAGIIGLPIGTFLGPSVLLPALAAAVIGRMERFSLVVASAVGIGVLEAAVFTSTRRSALVSPILFVVIIGALLVQRRAAGRLEAAQTSTWRAVEEFRPIPRELRHLPEVRLGKLAAGGALLAFLLSAPVWMSDADTILLGAMMLFGIVGLSLVVLTGWAGEVSLGQVAFVGLGAGVAGALTQRLEWDLALSLAVAGLVGALAAVAIGLPALRVRGMFLAVATLAFALATADYFLARQYFGGILPEAARLIDRPLLLTRISVATEVRFYFLILAFVVLTIGAVRGIRRSRTGRALIALRENERAAQAYGINATRLKLTAFALSGFIAAAAGSLFVHLQRALVINDFFPERSLAAFTMVVIGGLGSIPGALMGAAYVQGLTWFLPRWLPDELDAVAPLLGSGLGLILVLMLLPGGLAAVFYGARDGLLRRIAARRGILVPSLVADMRVEEPVPELVPTPLATVPADGGVGAGGDGRDRPLRAATKAGAAR